jgi:glycerol-3-phosphate dehydrogenase subunit B
VTARTQTLILGGGLAGASLALALAARGQAVAVAAWAPGGSAQWSGALDLFGPCLRDPNAPDHPITAPSLRLQHLRSRRPHHPYVALGLRDAAAVAEAAAAAAQPFSNTLDLTAHGWALTPLGWPRLCDGASPCVSVWGPDPSPDGAHLGVVGFSNVSTLDAPHAAATLRAHGLDATAYVVAAPHQRAPFEPDALAAARLLDAAPCDPTTWAEVAASLRAQSQSQSQSQPSARAPSRWLLPPLLGVSVAKARGHLQALSALLGAPVGEATAQHDSLHGWRLHSALTARLTQALGEGALTHRRALRLEASASGVQVTWSDGTQTAAERLVLATGRWLAGGLPRRGPWREPLTGAPLWLDGVPMRDTPDHAPRLLSGGFLDDHPLLRVGLAVDPTGHLLDDTGAPLSPRLYAVGGALGGTAHPTDGCAAGVALCSAAVVARALGA